MRIALALLSICFASVACSRGVAPSSVTYGAATYSAVGVPERFGTRPAVYGALTAPADITGCVAEGAAKGIVVISDTIRCVLNRLVPPPVVQVQQYAPMAAPVPCLPAAPLKAATPAKAPGCEPCARLAGECDGGNCNLVAKGR